MSWLERVLSRFRRPSPRCPLCGSDDLDQALCQACGYDPQWLDDPERALWVAQIAAIDEVLSALGPGRGVASARELVRAQPELLRLLQAPPGDPVEILEAEGHWEVRERWGVEAASLDTRYARILGRARSAIVSRLRLAAGPSTHYDVPRGKR